MKKDIRETARRIGTKVRKIREGKKLSRRTVALLAGISVETLQRIEDGQTNFRITTLAKIALALDVEVSKLFRMGP